MTRKLTCHCGAIELEVVLSDGLDTARRCDCSFCKRRGAIVASAPLDGIRIVKGANKLSLYQWGSKTALHYFCSVCGIYTHHQRRSNPNENGANFSALEGINPRDLGEIALVDGVNHPSDETWSTTTHNL